MLKGLSKIDVVRAALAVLAPMLVLMVLSSGSIRQALYTETHSHPHESPGGSALSPSGPLGELDQNSIPSQEAAVELEASEIGSDYERFRYAATRPELPPPAINGRDPWVTQGGSIDWRLAPRRITVTGPEGDLVLDDLGNPVLISYDEFILGDGPIPELDAAHEGAWSETVTEECFPKTGECLIEVQLERVESEEASP